MPLRERGSAVARRLREPLPPHTRKTRGVCRVEIIVFEKRTHREEDARSSTVLKKWSMVALLAAATAFVLAAFGACSGGDSGDGGPSVLARYASSDDELTFYDDDTFVLAGAGARAIGRTITGTYTGDPVTGTGLKLTASDGTTITVTPSGSNTLTITVDGTPYQFTKKSVSSGSTSGSSSSSDVVAVYENASTDAITVTFYRNGTFEEITEIPDIGYTDRGAYGTYTGDPSKDGEITMTCEFLGDYEYNKEAYDIEGIELNKPVTVTIEDGKCRILLSDFIRQQ